MDYWGNSMLQAVGWAAAQAERARMPLGVSGNPSEPVEADVGRFRSLWFVPRGSDSSHLDIRLLRGPRDGVIGLANRGDVLHRVTTADGTPLCVVLPGPAYRQIEARLRKTGGE
jgi:hypothetical protein